MTTAIKTGTVRATRPDCGAPTANTSSQYVSGGLADQGDTVDTAHVVIGEHTGAASAYVGMTRGRCNTAHLIAEDLTDAREQWITVFARDRADLGPAHAAQLAAAEAARYAQLPVPGPTITEQGRGIRRPEPSTSRALRRDAGAHIRR